MSRIDIELNGTRIESRGWAGPDTPALSKSVPGARWHPDGKFWSYPLDLGSCRGLRAAFGDKLRIGPELNAWARDQLVAESKLTTIAAGTSAELLNVPRYAPRIADAMANRTYQQTAAAFGARAGNFALFDQPGLGKTIEVLGALVEAQGHAVGVHLVLCPKVAVSSVWKAEIEQWLGDTAMTFALSGNRAERQNELSVFQTYAANPTRNLFVIGNIEMVRIKPAVDAETGKKVFAVANAEWPELFDIEWDSIIVDESHRALIRTSGQPTQTRAGFNKLRSKRRIALSGTPMRGKPEQLWGTLNWLRPDLYSSYWRWVERYFRLTSNGFSRYVLAGFKPGGEEQMANDMRSISLRRTKAEVLPELPAKSYAGTYLVPGDDQSPHAVWLEMDAKQAKQYRALVSEGAISFEGGGELMANGVLALNTREKQLAGACGKLDASSGKFVPTLPSPKFDWIVQKLDELGILEGEGEAKIVIASQFTSLLNLFAKELRSMGVALHLLTGETPDKARQAMVSDFQASPEVRVFMLNTKAGGVAVTLDAADDLVLLDETYVPDDQEQVEDRIHRTSRMHNVTIHNLRTLDTIEEEVAYITAARADVMGYLLDGSRGVENAKQVYMDSRRLRR